MNSQSIKTPSSLPGISKVELDFSLEIDAADEERLRLTEGGQACGDSDGVGLFNAVIAETAKTGNARIPSADRTQANPPRRRSSVCMRMFLRCLPYLIFLAYVVVGACLFHYVEQTAKLNALTDLSAARQSLSHKLCDVLESGNITSNCTHATREAFEFYEVELRQFYRPIVTEDKWNFAGSLVYSLTLITAIGYGDIVPITMAGRLLTVIYAICGMPLMFFILARFGRVLCTWLYRLWHWCRWFFCNKAKMKVFKTAEYVDVDEMGEFPISLAVLVTVGWWFASSALFMLWEPRWTYWTSLYFSFITLSTIGLGDVMPSNQKSLIINFVFIIWGLAMVSMCINLVQIKLSKIFNSALTNIQATYVEAQATETEMDSDAKAEVNNLLSKQPKYLRAMLGQSQRRTLLDAWKQKAALKSKAVQTEQSTADKAISCVMSSSEIATQIGNWREFTDDVRCYAIPSIVAHQMRCDAGALQEQNEVPAFGIRLRKHSSIDADECRGLFKEIRYLLLDCQAIVNSK